MHTLTGILPQIRCMFYTLDKNMNTTGNVVFGHTTVGNKSRTQIRSFSIFPSLELKEEKKKNAIWLNDVSTFFSTRKKILFFKSLFFLSLSNFFESRRCLIFTVCIRDLNNLNLEIVVMSAIWTS